MKKKEFLIRISIFAVFGLIFPLLFLSLRFGLFEKASEVSINGWGIVAIIIIAAFFTTALKQYKKGLPYSNFTHIINGMVKVVIPLIVSAVIVKVVEDCFDKAFQVLCVLIVCETVAVVVNPIPQWAHEHKIEEDKSSMKEFFSSLGVGKKEEETK